MNRNHDDTSEALLTAARRLLADHGPEALTVRRIASEAGMSTMNVYSRFGGKDGVIDELFSDGYRRLIDAVNAVPSTDDIIEDLMNVARAYRSFARANPTYYGIMFRSAVPGFEASPESVSMALGGLAELVNRVRRGQEVGQTRHHARRAADRSLAVGVVPRHGELRARRGGHRHAVVAHDLRAGCPHVARGPAPVDRAGAESERPEAAPVACPDARRPVRRTSSATSGVPSPISATG